MLIERAASLSNQNEFSFGRVVQPAEQHFAGKLFFHERHDAPTRWGAFQFRDETNGGITR